MVKFNFQTNFLLRKISKEASNFQLARVVLSLELPVRGLVIIIQYSNIVTLVTGSLDESLSQRLGKIVRKSMGSDPMRDSSSTPRLFPRLWPKLVSHTIFFCAGAARVSF